MIIAAHRKIRKSNLFSSAKSESQIRITSEMLVLGNISETTPYRHFFLTREEKFLREEESDPAKSKEGWVHTNLLLQTKKLISTSTLNFVVQVSTDD